MRRLVSLLVGFALLAVAQSATPIDAQGWSPGPAEYGVRTTTDIPLTMPDGRVLRATIEEPADATGAPVPGPFPVILTLTPYGKSVSGPIPRYLVERGYIGVAVDVAGTGGSEGASELFGPTEAADSKRLVEWAAALPRASGAVGMVGISYLAIDQLFAAAAVGPGSPLKAIFPVAAAADPYRDLFTSGGIVNVESSLGLLGAYAGTRTLTPLAERGPTDPLDAARLMVEHGLQAVPFEGRIALDVLLDGERRFDGPYWQERAPQRVLQDVVDNDIAVFLVGGAYDVFQRGTPLLYSGLQNAAAGRPVAAPMVPGQPASAKYQMLFGPWDHGNQGAGVDLNKLQLQWFDHWLKGVPTGITDTEPLQIIEPDGRLYRARTYPLEEATARRLHLAPGGGLRSAPAPTGAAPDQIAFTALSSPCTRSTQQWSAGLVPPATCGQTNPITEPPPIEMAYTSDPVAAPTTIAGPIGLTIHARANTADTMWVATLEDVAPDGSVSQLSAGALLGSLRAVDPARSWPGTPGGWLQPHHPLTRASQQPVVPGELTRYDIDIRPVFATLAPGHRLRVTIGTGDLPHLMPPFTSGPNLIGGIYAIEHGPTTGSWIDLPIVG